MSIIEMPDYKAGSTWPGIVVTVQKKVDDEYQPVSLVGADARMWFKVKGIVYDMLSIDDGDIVITDAESGILTVVPRVLSIESGVVSTDLLVILADDTRVYPITGTFNVLARVTE